MIVLEGRRHLGGRAPDWMNPFAANSGWSKADIDVEYEGRRALRNGNEFGTETTVEKDPKLYKVDRETKLELKKGK